MEAQDYYHILGVEKSATAQQVKDAYRKLAFQYHPDRNQGSPDASDKMKQVNEAYAVLSNPSKRKEYDELSARYGSTAYNQFRTRYTDQDIFTGSDIGKIFEETARAFGLRGFDEIFREFYGPGFRSFQIKRPGFFAKGFVFSPSFGKKESARIDNSPGAMSRIGKFLLKRIAPSAFPEKGKNIYDVIGVTLPHAQTGGPYAYHLRRKDKKLVVKIPPGIKDGQVIRLAGMGEAGTGGAGPGDLLLKVKIKRSWTQKIRDKLKGGAK
ncbi:MAG: DnaJ domain-containing protein [Thermodesulfobacteriota bacterium]